MKNHLNKMKTNIVVRDEISQSKMSFGRIKFQGD